LFDDETETAEDYREILLKALGRKLPMICANPDIIVERGDKMIYCAGAVAELYRELGGDVTFYGKPHLPAYQRAFELASQRRGAPTPRNRMLAIGDSVRTDLSGANNFGIACVFVTRGIHSAEFTNMDEIDAAASKQLFGDTKPPFVLMQDLRW
jgi:HAD superfamily hydrolase (TIGR01459 family)